MSSLTVKCPDCQLKLADIEHPDVAYERDGNNNILCPNCKVPMNPIGNGDVIAATEAFAQVNRELGTPALPPAETVESLSKRLVEIEHAHDRVTDAQARYEDKRDAAKAAKKHLDDELETFVTLTGRLSSFVAPLPLFTREAEEAAQAEDTPADDEVQGEAQALWAALMDAGYMAASIETVEGWGKLERDQARGWVTLGGSVDGMPGFMRALAQDEDDAPAAEPVNETTTSAAK